MGHISDKQNPVAFFKNQATLIIRHEFKCCSITSIFCQADQTLTLIPFGETKISIFGRDKLRYSSITDPVLFQKLFKKKIGRISFFPGEKTVIYFSNKQEEIYRSELSLKCLKCGNVFHEIHVKSGACFIVPNCARCVR